MKKTKINFEEKLTKFSVKLGSQIHLQSLRDGMSLLMPLFILAGIAILINFVLLPYSTGLLATIFPQVSEGDILARLQIWGNSLQNGTINMTGLLMAPAIGFAMAKNRNFVSPMSAAIMSLVSFLIMMPLTTMTTPVDASSEVIVRGMLNFENLGTKAMLAGIIIGLIATEVFVKLTKIEKLKVRLGEGVPPMVAQSFSSMFPAMITLSLFALFSAVLQGVFNTDLISLIFAAVQEPLRKVNTSLLGYILIYSSGNFLFTLGIHQSVVSGTLIEPFLLSNMNENMAAFANKETIPNIITTAFQAVYPQMGGTGATISLLLAIFIFSRNKASRDIGKLSLAPGIFEINEPLIFGYPIVYNLPLMIPFITLPIFNTLIAYFATSFNLVSKTVVMIPWVTPPLISGYLSTAGDLRTVLLQAILIVVGAFWYLPFMKISERVALNISKHTT